MKRVRVELVCDDGFAAISLQELALQICVQGFLFDEYYLEHGTAIIEPYEEEEE